MDRRQIAARALQFPLTILWLEGVIRLTCVGALAGRGLAYTLLFGLSGGLACGVLACLWGPRGNRRAAFFLTGLLTVWYMAQAAYFRVFKTFLTLDTVTLARSAMTDYWPVALSGILGALPILALLAVPLLLLCLWERRGRRKGRRERSTRPSCFAHTPRALAACLLVGAAVVQLTAVLAVAADDRGIQSPSELYRGPVEPELSVSHPSARSCWPGRSPRRSPGSPPMRPMCWTSTLPGCWRRRPTPRWRSCTSISASGPPL